MSTRTDLTITSTNHSDATKKVTNKVNYVNPNITNQQAVTLANMFVALTKDTYSNTTRTDTTDCDISMNRPITSLKYQQKTTPYYVNVPADGVINMTTDEIATSNSLRLQINTPFDGTCPMVLNLTDTAETNKVDLHSISYGGPAGLTDRIGVWQIQLQIDTNGSVAITPRTVYFTLHFNATNMYDAYDKEITFNITAEE